MGGGLDAGAWCAGGVGVAALNVPFSIFIGLNGKIIGGSRKGSFGEEAFEPVVWFGGATFGGQGNCFRGRCGNFEVVAERGGEHFGQFWAINEPMNRKKM